MTNYFKREAESKHGEGMAYSEVTDGWPARQVEVYGEVWRWADQDHKEGLADQPLEVLGLTEKDSISKEEFEQIWQEAKTKCP
jgi:hypothetical protein